MSSLGGELRECNAEPTPFCTHGSINPSLWHLLLLGKQRAVTNVCFFPEAAALWAQICQLRSPVYSPSVPVVCRDNWLCLFELVFIQGRETFV